jgi:membrane-associated phospholipid phosphatase
MSAQGLARFWPHFWFKAVSSTAFMSLFFTAYLHLLKNPSGAVTEMPLTPVDAWIPLQPWTVWIYVSLWVYVSLPVALMTSREDIVRYGLSIGALCLLGLGTFLVWPTAVPPTHVDWSQHPGMGILKGVDAAGNACPSLHVATAVFSGIWLHWMTPWTGGGWPWRLASVAWCIAIAYSTVSTRQHVFIDVCAGAGLGLAIAWLTRPRQLLRG